MEGPIGGLGAQLQLEIPPGIGEQVSSMRPSSARYSFGTSTRQNRMNLAMPEFKYSDVDRLGRETPGAVYDLPAAVGTAPTTVFGTGPRVADHSTRYPDSSVDLAFATVDSQKVKYPTARNFLFGTEARDEIKNAEILKRHPQAGMLKESPGCIYDPDDTRARPMSAPLWTMRPKTPIQASRPQTSERVGPNSYRAQEAIGTQPLSTKKTGRASSFSRAARFPTSRRDGDGDGGGEGPPPSSMGRQVDGRFKSQPCCGFGSGTRDKRSRTAYLQVQKDMGPRGNMAPPHLEHPRVARQQEIIRYGSNRPKIQ